MHAAETALDALAARWREETPPAHRPLLERLLCSQRQRLVQAIKEVIERDNEAEAAVGVGPSPLADLLAELRQRSVDLWSPEGAQAIQAEDLAAPKSPSDYLRAPRRLDDVRAVLGASLLLASGRCIPLVALTEAMRSEAVRREPKGEGRLQVNRAALYQAMGAPTLVEASELGQAKASGRPTANVGRMWSFMTTSVYRSADLPILATREAVQNGVDAIRAAIKAKQIGKGEGHFRVVVDQDQHSITWDDNGIGMDEGSIFTKFLDLGSSGKGAAADSGEAAGGFGVAKAVILGTSTTFRWRLYTRNNLAESEGLDAEIKVYDAPYRQGFQLTVFDVSPKYDTQYVYALNRSVGLHDRLQQVLAANDLPDITFTLDGKTVPPLFPRNRGSKIPAAGSWGEGTTATIKGYRRPPGDRGGAYYVRLGGLYQFMSSGRGLKMDIVIDLTTTVRPGALGYPFNAARDAFQGQADHAFNDLREEVERETESAARSEEDEIYDPDSDDAEIRQETEEISESVAEALADPELQAVLADAVGGIVDYYTENEKGTKTRAPVESDAPAGTREREEDQPSRDPILPAGIRSAGAQFSAPDSAMSGAAELLGALTDADAQADANGSGTRALTYDVKRTLTRAGEGALLDDVDIRTIQGALTRAAEQASAPSGGGMMQVAAITTLAAKAMSKMQLTEEAQEQVKTLRSPFGAFAGLRISRKNYDRRKAARFRKNYARWIPHLTIWDSILRLVAAEARMRRKFKPGFILDDEYAGLAASGQGTSIIYVNPDRFEAAVRAHRERPLAIAGILHGIAVHELTHLDGRMGEGHNEGFTTAREDLGAATIHLLPAFSLLIQKVLKLPIKPSEDQRRLARLERQLEKAKSAKGTEGRALVEQRREVAALRAALAEAQAASAAAAKESGLSCETCRTAPREDVSPTSFVDAFVGVKAIYNQARHAILHGEPEPKIAKLHRSLWHYARRLGEMAIACSEQKVEGMRNCSRRREIEQEGKFQQERARHDLAGVAIEAAGSWLSEGMKRCASRQAHGFELVKYEDIPFWTLNMGADSPAASTRQHFCRVGREGNGYDWAEVLESVVSSEGIEWDPESGMFAANARRPEPLERVAKALRKFLTDPKSLVAALRALPKPKVHRCGQAMPAVRSGWALEGS